MNKQASTKENINKLIEFCQAVYAQIFIRRRDALFDALDALLSSGTVSSFAMLSQSERFCKETLGWSLPRFQCAETGDTWTQLVMLTHWLLFLTRPIVADVPLPWQKPQKRLTPQRVRQSLKPIFALIGTPALPPKNCAENHQVGAQVVQNIQNAPPGRPKSHFERTKPLDVRLVRRNFTTLMRCQG